MARPRGTGSIYSIKGSNVLWIKYYRNGVPIRESSGSSKVKTAEKLLRLRIGAISSAYNCSRCVSEADSIGAPNVRRYSGPRRNLESWN